MHGAYIQLSNCVTSASFFFQLNMSALNCLMFILDLHLILAIFFIVILQISPHCGGVLGGTPIRISVPQFEEKDQITCLFDNTRVEGKYLDAKSGLCISPQFKKIGRITLKILVMWTNGTAKYESQLNFYSGMYLFFVVFNYYTACWV